MSDFDPERFRTFCNALTIDSKERGQISLGSSLLGTQRWVMSAIGKGLEDGVRDFTTLKCRQIGISTISLALDLYWVMKYPGLSGALVVHDDGARDQFRTTLDVYHEGLPDDWKRRKLSHNRNQLVFANKSRLQYKVAGTTARKAGGALGRSTALAFLHATEMSSWGDPEGVTSLRSSLAETNPIRFYHWESTARGFNLFYDMWEEAKRSITQRAIFVSFWANEFYRAPVGTEIWRSFWGKFGKLTPEERGWVRDCKLLYDVEIDDEQIAWYRWKISDSGDELIVQQEFPPTEHHAFLATGSQFFGARAISDAIKRTKAADDPDFFRVEFKQNFWETEVAGTSPRQANLRIWEHPQSGAQYVLGADPSYGSSELHDNHCVSVWRCYGDFCVQVAEFADADLPTYACAWAVAWLAGAYDPCLVNMEISGPGQVVYNELQHLKKIALLQLAPQARQLMNIVRAIQTFLYKRVDQLSGMPNSMHWVTTLQSKERYMNTFRDWFERDYAVPRSEQLVDEMKGIVRETGQAPAASSRTKDDRVTAGALAVTAWSEMLVVRLRQKGMMRQQGEAAMIVNARRDVAATNPTSRLVQNLLSNAGWKA